MLPTAHEHPIEPAVVQESRPRLAVVSDQLADAAATSGKEPRDEESRIGRAAMVGAAIGFALVTIVITIAGTLGGIEPVSAFGLGVFVGFWGGGGFGFMTAASLSAARHSETLGRDRSINHTGGH